MFSDDNDLVLATCDSCVYERSCQHHVMRTLQVDNNCTELQSLAFMDGGSIAVVNHIHFNKVVFLNATISEIDLHQRIIANVYDLADISDVAVVHVLEVTDLHHLVPLSVYPAASLGRFRL